jgi:hypothetical protein
MARRERSDIRSGEIAQAAGPSAAALREILGLWCRNKTYPLDSPSWKPARQAVCKGHPRLF